MLRARSLCARAVDRYPNCNFSISLPEWRGCGKSIKKPLFSPFSAPIDLHGGLCIFAMCACVEAIALKLKSMTYLRYSTDICALMPNLSSYLTNSRWSAEFCSVQVLLAQKRRACAGIEP